MMRRIAALVIASQMAAAPLMAATLVPLTGRVSVDTGRGFRVVTGAVTVKPGDRVSVGLGGEARIQYAESCSAPVSPGSTVAVAPGIPCSTLPPGEPGSVSLLGPIIGGGALIGGFGLAAALAGGDDRTPPLQPISP